MLGWKLIPAHRRLLLVAICDRPLPGQYSAIGPAASICGSRSAATSYDGRVNPRDNPWRRRSRKLVYENAWIEVLHDEVTRPDGEAGIYGVVHFRHLAVGVVPLDAETDRVLLVGQFRYVLDRYSWEIPEGGAGLDEEPLEAGAPGASWPKRRATPAAPGASCAGPTSPTRSATRARSSLRPRTWWQARPRRRAASSLETRWVAFDEALAMIARGEITDAMTILALQQLALERAAR